jgi:hypothetical protein
MPELSKQAGEALKLFEEGCVQHHRGFLDRLKERYRAYHGILDQRSDAASWESKLAPKFVNHIVDSSLAAIVDGKLSYRVKPRPHGSTTRASTSVFCSARARTDPSRLAAARRPVPRDPAAVRAAGRDRRHHRREDVLAPRCPDAAASQGRPGRARARAGRHPAAARRDRGARRLLRRADHRGRERRGLLLARGRDRPAVLAGHRPRRLDELQRPRAPRGGRPVPERRRAQERP